MPDGLSILDSVEATAPMGLTLHMRDCMRVIQDAVEHSGVAPSYDELMSGLGLRSKSQVFRLVHSLIDRGYLRQLRGRRRCLQVLRRVPVEASDPAYVMSADLAERRGQ